MNRETSKKDKTRSSILQALSRMLVMLAISGYGVNAAVAATPAANTEGVDGVTKSRESLFPSSPRNLSTSHFTWGAEVGSSIDLSGHDMSTFDADVLVGYKNPMIRLAGIGAGVHRAFGVGNNFVPLYAVFRSSFRSKPSLCFFHLKAGYSFNTIGDSPTFGDWVGSIGCGVNLAMSNSFRSHILLAFGFRHFNERHQSEVNLDVKDVYMAQISFGVNF